MGKKKITTPTETPTTENAETAKVSSKLPKKKITAGTLYVQATFNNTKAIVSDKNGNALFWSSAGSLGFKGAQKGTPFAASKVGEVLGEKAQNLGIKEANVVIK